MIGQHKYIKTNHLFQVIEELEKCETALDARKYLKTVLHLKNAVKQFFEIAYGNKNRFKFLFDKPIKYRGFKTHHDRALFYFSDFLKEFQYFNKESKMTVVKQKIKLTSGLESICKQDAEIFHDMIMGEYKNDIITPKFIKEIFLDINISF